MRKHTLDTTANLYYTTQFWHTNKKKGTPCIPTYFYSFPINLAKWRSQVLFRFKIYADFGIKSREKELSSIPICLPQPYPGGGGYTEIINSLKFVRVKLFAARRCLFLGAHQTALKPRTSPPTPSPICLLFYSGAKFLSFHYKPASGWKMVNFRRICKLFDRDKM